MPATEFGWLPTQKKKKTAISMAKKNHPNKMIQESSSCLSKLFKLMKPGI